MDTSGARLSAVTTGHRAKRPLTGVTITLVEDSQEASEALRLMAVASGARLRRADRLMTAEKHLSLYRPTVMIVDIGLPDGNGLDLVAHLAQAERGRPGLIALSGGDIAEWGQKAYRAGADAVMPKPVENMAAFQACVLSVIPVSPQATAPPWQALLSRARDHLQIALCDGDADAAARAAQEVQRMATGVGDRVLETHAQRVMESASLDPGGRAEVEALVAALSDRWRP